MPAPPSNPEPDKLDPSVLHEIIESIVSLTEHRDQRSLEHSLTTSLREMLEPAGCWLLKVDGDASDGDTPLPTHCMDGLSTELLEKFKESPQECAFHIHSCEGLDYLVAPTLASEDDELRLLVLAQPKWDEGNLRLIQGMLKVYQNFVSLLQDSEKDTLTGLLNRKRLEAKLTELLMATVKGRRYKDRAHSDYLAVLDIDRFKRINDTFGHLIGDETLLVFANILRRTLRDDDLIFRYGGEEFIVLLQELTEEQTGLVLERVRRNVENHVFPQVGQVTVSIGYTGLQAGMSPTQAIEQADRALYFAKENGRNQTADYARLIAAGKLPAPAGTGSVDLF